MKRSTRRGISIASHSIASPREAMVAGRCSLFRKPGGEHRIASLLGRTVPCKGAGRVRRCDAPGSATE